MHKIGILVFAVFFFFGCKQESIIHPTFYFWKTVYQKNQTETDYLTHFKSKSLYVRIMDINMDEYHHEAIPISPIVFKDVIPPNIEIVPVVFIVNEVFNRQSELQNRQMAAKTVQFVVAKVKQAGKKDFKELQVDCDWTPGTKSRYFAFLENLKADPQLKGKNISVTLRMHQVKNILTNGIPPVNKAMLMCYNMGNLRKYGEQNSILNMNDMEAYLKGDLENYPLKLDVALPLFKWAVVFRNKQYAGISKRLTKVQINNKALFKQHQHSILYTLLVDYPEAGLKKGDVIRWEETSLNNLFASSGFLSRYLKAEDRNLVFYHLDAQILKDFNYDALEKVIDRL